MGDDDSGEHAAGRPGELVLGWVCQSNTDPAGIGKVATITAQSSS